MAGRDTTVNVSYEGRDDLRRFAAIASGVLTRRVNMPDALRLSIAMSENQSRSEFEDAAVRLGLIERPPSTESIGETQ